MVQSRVRHGIWPPPQPYAPRRDAAYDCAAAGDRESGPPVMPPSPVPPLVAPAAAAAAFARCAAAYEAWREGDVACRVASCACSVFLRAAVRATWRSAA